MVDSTQVFDAARYLSKVSGSDYLEVKWRLLWLRTNHPNALISTEMISHSDRVAVFKAVVEIPRNDDGTGGGMGTGHGSETPGDFRDYIEKAETKAIGRALGSLGFGTQFSQDFVFGADSGRVVDAPINRPQARPDPTTFQRARDAAPVHNVDPNGGVGERMATVPMRNIIGRLGGQVGYSPEELNDMFGPSDQLTFAKASTIIDGLKAQIAGTEQE